MTEQVLYGVRSAVVVRGVAEITHRLLPMQRSGKNALSIAAFVADLASRQKDIADKKPNMISRGFYGSALALVGVTLYDVYRSGFSVEEILGDAVVLGLSAMILNPTLLPDILMKSSSSDPIVDGK